MTTELRKPILLPTPTPGAPPAPSVPRPERFTLGNGLRVVAIERHDFPQIAARMVVPAGSSADPAAWPGAASLTASLLTEGTQRYSGIELNERIDMLGASICARAGHDFAEVDLGLLAETLDEGLGLFAEIIASPAFPEKDVERVRAEALDAFEARLDEPANIADDRAAVAVFDVHHPYGRLPLGTPEGVVKIRRSDLVTFHSERYRPEGCVLVIAGDFNTKTLRTALENAFSGWAGIAPLVSYPDPPTAAAEAGQLTTIDWEDAAQGEIRIAGIGIPRASSDWVSAAVANYILGGSTITGRLGANLREDKGWTYGVRSSFSAGIHPGGWSIDTAVDGAVVDRALAEIESELIRFTAEPVSDEELDRAKEALILSLPRAFETPGRIVARFATLEAFGLPAGYWEAFPAEVAKVTRDDVLAVAADQFVPEKLVRVAVRAPT